MKKVIVLALLILLVGTPSHVNANLVKSLHALKDKLIKLATSLRSRPTIEKIITEFKEHYKNNLRFKAHKAILSKKNQKIIKSNKDSVKVKGFVEYLISEAEAKQIEKKQKITNFLMSALETLTNRCGVVLTKKQKNRTLDISE